MPATKTVTTACWKCQGTGRYDAPTCYPGGCFACKGTGYHTTTPAAIARREAREAKAEAAANETRARSAIVIERLMTAWGDEFAHIDDEYRSMHVTQKAERLLYQEHGMHTTCTADMGPHLHLLGV